MKKLILFSFLVVVFGQIVSAQNDIVVDNGQAVFEGNWDTARASKDRYGADYRATYCVAGAATATATFTPQIGVSGKYNVEVLYPRGDNRATNAPWFISYDGGTLTTNISQRISGGKWVRLASGLPFAPGAHGFVRLSNNSGEDKDTTFGKAVVIADAVRFVLVGQNTAAPSNKGTTGATVVTAWRYGIKTFVKAGGGKVRITPDQPGYAGGEVVQIEAQPESGNVFVGWSGDVTGLDNPVRVKISNNVIATAEFLPEALGVIMESSEANIDGKWAPNTQKWAGQRSDSYLFAIASPESNCVATFRPKLPKPGKYDVYIYYLQGENRATQTTWEVAGKSEVTMVEVDQRANGRQWFQIASGKEFEAGSNGYVRVSGKAEPLSSVVVADSVAFVYVRPPDGK